ncbi:MAG: tRNA lysidine(34) synthetase TilS [Limnochordaceae bacterium]|nr:tRNA lysidine(34) synthetase TilS [Limnochordaceae bacterium]
MGVAQRGKDRAESMMDQLLRRVGQEIQRRHLIALGQRVLVALSGGPDSSVLLHLLVRLAPTTGWQVAAAHLHHALRGPAADADCQRAEDLARELGVPIFVRRVDVRALAQKESLSIEAAGRRARYRFFSDLIQRPGFDRVALGHHQDDQAETVLLHLLQGSGLHGLAGMAWQRGRYYIRPLLSVSRAEIEQYVREWGWQPAQDLSNQDPTFLRNRLRHQLLPLLEKEYAPGLRHRLAQLAEVVRAEDELIEELLDQAWARLDVQPLPAGWSVQAREWDQLPKALRRRAARRLLSWVMRGERETPEGSPGEGNPTTTARTGEIVTVRGASYRLIERMAAVPLPARVQLPRGWSWSRSSAVAGQERYILKLSEPSTTQPCMTLPIPGKVTWQWMGLPTCLSAHVLVAPPPGRLWSCDLNHPHIDAEALQGKVWVRGWQPGDRLRPLGLAGTKKVQDVFVDKKVPSEQRSQWPIVCDEGGIIWIPGLALDERVRITPASQHWLQLDWRVPSQPPPSNSML